MWGEAKRRVHKSWSNKASPFNLVCNTVDIMIPSCILHQMMCPAYAPETQTDIHVVALAEVVICALSTGAVRSQPWWNRTSMQAMAS